MIVIMSQPWFARLEKLVGNERALHDGEILFRAGEKVRHLYLVREGLVLLARVQRGGDPLVLQRAAAGTMVAEASVFAVRYHCDGVCSGPTRVGQILRSDVERSIAIAVTQASGRAPGRLACFARPLHPPEGKVGRMGCRTCSHARSALPSAGQTPNNHLACRGGSQH
jgi:CRP-like cAMP-binding protein